MKKLILGVIAAVASIAIIAGCKSIPDVEQMTKLGSAAGFTYAYVLDKQVGVTNAVTRDVIREVIENVDKYTPATNETCYAKWTPMIEKLTDSYVESGSMTRAQADRVVKDFKTVMTMLDNYIDKKGIRQYQDLVDAFIHAFSDKFLSSFKPINVTSVQSDIADECDSEMLEYLMTNMK